MVILPKSFDLTNYLKFNKIYIMHSINSYQCLNQDLKSVTEVINLLKSYQLLDEVYTYTYDFSKPLPKQFSHYIFHESKYNHFKTNTGINQDINSYRMLSINEVCKTLSITRPTAYLLINSKAIPSYRINNQYKIRLVDLLDYISQNKAI